MYFIVFALKSVQFFCFHLRRSPIRETEATLPKSLSVFTFKKKKVKVASAAHDNPSQFLSFSLSLSLPLPLSISQSTLSLPQTYFCLISTHSLFRCSVNLLILSFLNLPILKKFSSPSPTLSHPLSCFLIDRISLSLSSFTFPVYLSLLSLSLFLFTS